MTLAKEVSEDQKLLRERKGETFQRNRGCDWGKVLQARVVQKPHQELGGEDRPRVKSSQTEKQERLERSRGWERKSGMRKETEQGPEESGACSPPGSGKDKAHPGTPPLVRNSHELTHWLCCRLHLLTGPRIGWQPSAAISFSLRSNVWATSSLGESIYHRPHLICWLFKADLTGRHKMEAKIQSTVENPWLYGHTKYIFPINAPESCSSNEHEAFLYAVKTA